MQLPAHIAERIRGTLEELEPPGRYHIDGEAKHFGGIALMGTIGSVWLLRPDGTFLDVDSDWGKEPGILPPEWHATAIVAGVERYPWLAELLPVRPPSAPDCPHCSGQGLLGRSSTPSEPRVFCPTCKALGWLSA